MAPEDTTGASAPANDVEETPAGEFHRIGPVAATKITGEAVQANLSAVATVAAGSLSATGSAIGVASVDGDANITASFVPALMTRGDTTVQQSYTSAVIVGSGANTKVHQAFAPIIVGKTTELSQSGAALLVAGEADVKKSWVGIVLAPSATVSEDSRVVIDTKGALIVAAALFGGLALVALAVSMAARRVVRWRPWTVPDFSELQRKMPDLSQLQRKMPDLAELSRKLPDLSAIQERLPRHRA